MKQRLCLFTDSLDPSGMGELMITLARELHGAYDVSFAIPSSATGDRLLAQAAELGLCTLDVSGDAERTGDDVWRDWLEAERIEIVHTHAGVGWEGFSGVRAARAAGVPVVIRTEHLPYLLTHHAQHLDHLRIVGMLDRLVCVSEEARATFVRGGVPDHKLSVVRNGIVPQRVVAARADVRTSLDLDPAALVVLTVARFTEQKNHRVLADAARRVVAHMPNAHFVWVGEGWLEGALRDQVHALGLDQHVHFVGRRADVPQLMAAADVLAVPSLFEGLPLVVLEAMAVGLPIVGTRVCGVSETVRDGVTGCLVAVDDPVALADRLVALLGDQELRMQYTYAARHVFDAQWTAGRMARDMSALYQQVWGEYEQRQCPTSLQTLVVGGHKSKGLTTVRG